MPHRPSPSARAAIAPAAMLLLSGGLAQAGPPDNDVCEGRVVIGPGLTEFDNIGAGDGGPEASCGDGRTDIWFEYRARSTGLATVRTCGSGFDTVLAAYLGALCPTHASRRLACNNDTCDEQSVIEFEIIDGISYLIQVGGHRGAEGRGRILIVEEDQCPADVTGDCEIDVHDIIEVILAWDRADPDADVNGSGGVEIGDLIDVVLAWGVCGPCAPGCAGADGDCCAANGTRACEHAGCCTAVCAIDPACCQVKWDQVCANAAATVCPCSQ